MNIKSLLLGSMAALCLLALPASAASDIAPFHPCPVASDPGSGTGTIFAASPIDTVVAPPGIEGVVLAAVIKPNNPMPLPEQVAKRTSAQPPSKPIDVTTLASIETIIEGDGGITAEGNGGAKLEGSGLV